jgi:tRNA-intron endonuclease
VIEILEAFYAGNKVHIPLRGNVNELRERGFGTLKGNKLFFSPHEVFYLVEKGRIKVSDAQKNVQLSLRDLVEKFSARKPDIWIKYLIYRDLRDRGYIVREAKKVDFEIYGKGATRRLVSIIYEGREASLKDLSEKLEYAVEEKKDLILAVIDRRTDIVYYHLSSLSLN